MEKSLHKSALRIIDIVNRDVEHIPPILTTEANPFPYRIVVNPVRGDAAYGSGRGLF
jgi:autophagy-related protein 101